MILLYYYVSFFLIDLSTCFSFRIIMFLFLPSESFFLLRSKRRTKEWEKEIPAKEFNSFTTFFLPILSFSFPSFWNFNSSQFLLSSFGCPVSYHDKSSGSGERSNYPAGCSHRVSSPSVTGAASIKITQPSRIKATYQLFSIFIYLDFKVRRK